MNKLTILTLSALAAVTSPVLALAPQSLDGSAFTYAKSLSLVAAVAPMSRADLAGLVGHSVRNADGKKIGDIEAVYVNKDGSVKQVIVGVGGFLGIGEHNVALGWDNLHFSTDGKDINVRISKKELKALPKFEYAKATYRGTVFTDD